MKLTKKQEKEITKVYDTWLHSYLNGDIETYDSFLDDDYHFIGSTNNEEFLNRKETTKFFIETADQLAGKTEIRNGQKTIEKFGELVILTHVFDAWFLSEAEWSYYGKFRFTSTLQKKKEGWRFVYQHFSTPDIMANEGETLGIDKITAENLELRNAIKRRTVELELKNRELEVEAALERIRAKVTAMSQSSDLLDIVVTMRTEFIKLGHEAHYFWQMRWLPDMYQKAMTSGDGSRIGMIMELPRDFHSHYEGMSEWENNKEPFIVLALETEIAVDYIDKMIRQGNFQQVDPNAPSLDDVRHIGGLTFVSARTEHGEIGYSLPGVVKNPPKEDLDILVRFAGAFDLAHKRFEDLRRSEQQARETKIELGLERVRARAMAMQDSSELSQLVDTVFKELSNLDFALSWCIINIIDEASMSNMVWGANTEKGKLPDSYFMKFEDHRFHHEMLKAYQDRLSKWVFELAGKEKIGYDDYLFSQTEFKRVSVEVQKEMRKSERYVGSFTFSDFGGIQTIGEEPLSDENLDILARFGKVFDLTYTRFNDLKLAEAQARESRIELSLERVRARTMAMQQSEELGDVATVLFKELNELVENLWTCGFVLCEKDSNEDEWWLSTEEGFIPPLFLPNVGDDTHHNIYEAWKNGASYHTEQLEGQALLDHYDWLMTIPAAKEVFDDMKASGQKRPLWQKLHCAYFSYGYLVMITEVPCPEEEIFKRFAKVFDQTYTRFLDLQKSEKQAREAEVELALERVRARTMAMQHSEELAEVATILFQQVGELGIPQWTCGFNIWETGDTHFTFYPGGPDGEILASCKVPLMEHPIFRQFDESKKRGDELLVYEKEGEIQADHYRYMHSLPGIGDMLQGMLDSGLEFPTYQIDHVANFSYGNIIFITYEPFPKMYDVFKRFAKVFEQTYTRFLDLQKAEAQAREAQIEAALEKVRSRSLAMQKPEELQEVVAVVAEKLKELGVIFDAGGVILCTYFPDNKDVMHWIAVDDFSSSGSYFVPYFDNPIFNDAWDSKIKGDAYFSKEFSVKAKNEFFKHAFKNSDYRYFPDDYKQHVLQADKHNLSAAWSKNSAIIIPSLTGAIPSESDAEIMKRFAKVFEQAYIRFMDLQKAEAQAREAQIEAALERVRSRTMAMHNSSELAETAAVLFQQLKELGIDHERTNIGIVDEANGKIDFWLTTQKGNLVDKTFPAIIDESNTLKTIYKGYKEKRKSIILEQKGVELKRWISFITNKLGIPYTRPTKNEIRVQNVGYISQGMLIVTSNNPLNDESVRILERFAAVFEQTYTRFLDLQKAEVQAREAQIEGALERVRSKTMAMHNSQDVGATIGAMFDELVKLGIEKSVRCGIGILDHIKPMELWTASSNSDGEVLLNIGFLDMSIHPLLEGVKKSWEQKEVNFKYELKGKNVLKYFTALNESPDYLFQTDLDSLPNKIIHNSFPFPEGTLFAFSPAHLTIEEEQIFKRFTGVFAQTYTRYLDLLKAEAQTREVQIEAALERVRSKTMAMHNSRDVKETVKTFFDEVLKLGIDNTIRCGIGILEGHAGMETWSANAKADGDVEMRVGMLNMGIHPMLIGLKKAWEKGENEYAYTYEEKDVLKYYKALNNEPEYPFNADLDNLPKREFHKSFFYSSGIIFTFTENPLTEESSLVLHRFAEVFGQTYRRYLDLRKAEAQAKEAQIEAALEKVRSRTMAMQASSELGEAAHLLFQEVQTLGINAWSTGYNILNEDKTQSECWMSSSEELQEPFPLYYTEEASFIEMGNFLKSEEDFFVQELSGKDLEQHYAYMTSLPALKKTFKQLADADLSLPTHQVNHLCKFSQGYLLFITYEPVPKDHEIFKRFAKVFEQTYTRFLDLKKAEKQSQEAQIELALERVRASSMAMHKSEQMAETAEVLFEQFDLLGIIPDRISIAIFNEKKRLIEFWSTKQSGAFFNHGHYASIDEPTFLSKTYKAWKEGKETLKVDMNGKELKNWVQYVKEEMKMELDESKFKGRRVQHCAFFSQGYLLLSSHLPITDETEQILLRFTKVFQQIYIRFLDHQKAEKLAREEIKRASVDRVRAEIASMRTGTDLNRITPLIWNELTTLDVPFIRCGVFIMDEEQQQVQTHLSTPDGKAIASFQIPYEDTRPLDQLLPYWRKNELYTDFWDEKAFIESTKILMQRGAIKSSENYITENQPTNLYLHFFPFLQGMLYVGSEVSLSDDELNLAQNLAGAFSSAYARYEDFNKLELANKKIEKTLVDLKQTQAQLVQSEKMASLGELTAGIAHEIQNPLNFVNNFSEVSVELVEEMNEEIEEGNLDFAKEIATDLKQNLDKINHHGKRAGEIVKGMLQHSRTSSGQKELTNMNTLADEYLRLAYHGLRAKDKSFNAKMESNFDPDLPELTVIPQDIGRVILNMITNAFYAVNEKKNQEIADYEPTVRVSTKMINGTIEISVKDNGNGIPKKALDKIFQPFFTTKPTGKGTGLGLSLSYDIVKAHGGELKVETKEGDGSQFVIILPV